MPHRRGRQGKQQQSLVSASSQWGGILRGLENVCSTALLGGAAPPGHAHPPANSGCPLRGRSTLSPAPFSLVSWLLLPPPGKGRGVARRQQLRRRTVSSPRTAEGDTTGVCCPAPGSAAFL